jgi:hypothetical protein
MKKTLALLIFLLPLLATAQEVVFDTTYHQLVGENYFIIQRLAFDNGEYEEKSRLIGDSATYRTFLITTSVNEANALTAAAMVVIKRHLVRQRFALLGNLYAALTGVDFWRDLNRQYYPELEGSWRIRQNAGAWKEFTTELMPNGNARFKDSQNFIWNFRAFSSRSIILIGWENANWELYSEDGKVFQDLNRTLRLEKL